MGFPPAVDARWLRQEHPALDAAAQAYPLLRQALARYRAGGREALFESGLAFLVAGAVARIATER